MSIILTKKKDTSGAPSASDLTNSTGGAELAVNTADKRLYTKDSGGNIVEVGTNPSTIDILRVNGTDPLNSTVAYIQSASDYTGWTASNQSFGELVQNTSLKSYPPTAGGSWILIAGRSINTEVGTNDTITANFNFVYNDYSKMTKTAGSTSDIDRLYFTNRYTVMTWEDPNTCKQYVGHTDNFSYQGIDANGRTSGTFNADAVALAPPSGGTQTISFVISSGLTIQPTADATVNITNWYGTNPPNLRFINSGGILNSSITTATFFGTSPFWDLNAAYSGSSVTIGNLYGLRLTAPNSQTNTTVTNNWGISQEWADAKNYFAGNLLVGTTTTPHPEAKLSVSGGGIQYDEYVSFADTSPNGKVFTITGGSNGNSAYLELEVVTYEGYRKEVFFFYNNAGTWIGNVRSTATDGTAPTFTKSANGATITVTVASTTSYTPRMVVKMTSNITVS